MVTDFFGGGDEGDRTPDLLNAIQAATEKISDLAAKSDTDVAKPTHARRRGWVFLSLGRHQGGLSSERLDAQGHCDRKAIISIFFERCAGKRQTKLRQRQSI
jgi:hypothetical protein